MIEQRAEADRGAEWIAKLGLVIEEADETVFWLEMLSDCSIARSERCEDILKEARERRRDFHVIAAHGTAWLDYQITNYKITK